MQPWHVKTLKAGDAVIWSDPNDAERHGMTGVVSRKYYNTVWILWLDGEVREHKDDGLRPVFTQAQLDSLEQEKRAVAAVNQMNKDRLKTHYADGTKIPRS